MTAARVGGAAAIACALLVGAARQAHAEDEIVAGSVMKIEDHEIYVNAGALKGIEAGAALRVKRPVRLRHPITRAVVDDWIPIASVTVTQAGATLSRAVVGDLVAQIKVGDVIEILVDRPDAPAPAAPTAPTAPPQRPAGPPPDPRTVEVLGIFAGQTGKPLDARIAGWEQYLSSHQDSPYAPAIRADLDALRGLRDQLRATSAPTGSAQVSSVRHAPRTRAAAGEAIPLVFVLDAPDAVASGYVHYRPRGARTYRRVMLQREHDRYLRGAIPADAVAPPGVDYFLEVSSPAGAAGLAAGTPAEPIAIAVATPTVADRFAARPGLSSVKLAADYLDFATFDTRAGDHRDRLVTATIDFTYRLAPGIVRFIGVGYGVYAGQGGSADAVWDDANPIPKTGFHYGYADLELGGAPGGVDLSVGGKLIAGVGEDGFGMGGEGRVRIGRREGTNLALAARTIDQVGTLSDIRFGASPAPHLLLGISVGATTQPNQDDVGVKLGTEVEWIGFSNVSLILRASWQGRNADHGGLGGGGGVGVSW